MALSGMLLSSAVLVLGLVLLGTGIALLAQGSRKRAAGTEAGPQLTFGITALLLGAVLLVPALIGLLTTLPLLDSA